MSADVWSDLVFPLSVRELQRLSWFAGKVAATVHLGQYQEFVEPYEASRLSFAKWLHITGRISEFVGVNR